MLQKVIRKQEIQAWKNTKDSGTYEIIFKKFNPYIWLIL